jgi:hypothetical protein
METEVGINSYGLRIGIQMDDPALAESVLQHLPPGCRHVPFFQARRIYRIRTERETQNTCESASGPGSFGAGGLHRSRTSPEGLSGPSRRHYSICVAERQRDGSVGCCTPLEAHGTVGSAELLRLLESDMHLHIAARARQHLFVHAGVVAWQDRAIVIPGPSFSGKTTLVEAFLRKGAHYLSDEYAVFTRSGRVRPFPRPLSLRVQNRSEPVRVAVPPREPHRSLAVRLFIFTHFQPGTLWKPSRLTAGRAVLGLIANTVPARSRPRLALSILTRVGQKAAAVEGIRGDADEVAGSVMGWMTGDSDLKLQGVE